MAVARALLAALLARGALAKKGLSLADCEVKFDFDVREWVVDYLKPTISLPGKASRKAPFDIGNDRKKSALLVNNQYPGPLVEAVEGQLVCVNVTNNLLEASISIHWHGLHMRDTPFMDGVYGVTQAGILAQGGNFVYRFRGNAGTHFWHAHMQSQQMDRGLRGPIVIRPKEDPHKELYTEERIVALSDEWQSPKVCLRNEGGMPGNPVCSEIDKASWNGQWGDGSEEYPWPLVQVEKGKCYRLRFIAMMGQAQSFQVAIAGHEMTLIAVDGADVQPLKVSQFNLHAGERADVVICADQEPGNYLMTATYDLACALEKAPAYKMPKVDSCNFWAFLNYRGHDYAPAPTSKKPEGGYVAPKGTGGGYRPKVSREPVWDTTFRKAWGMLKNLESSSEPEQPGASYVIDLGVTGPEYAAGSSPYATTAQGYIFTEQKPWKKPATPLLQTKGSCGAEGVPFITIDKAQTVELVINNLSPSATVLHMHGTRFSVVNYANFSESWCSLGQSECSSMSLEDARKQSCPGARASAPGTKFPGDAYWGCPYDPKKDAASQNLTAPLQKDMISLWRRSWAVIRFKADHPGTWLFNCQMEQHKPTGQMMAFNILPKEQPAIPRDVPTEGPCRVWSQADRKYEGRPPKPDFLV